MSAETSFNIGDEVLFRTHDGTWRQGTIVEIGENTATISWYDKPNASSHLTTMTFGNISKIKNQ